MRKITIYTDGSSVNNQNQSARQAGAAYIIIKEDKVFYQSAYLDNNTNNYAELYAVLLALQNKNITSNSQIELISDSNYVVNTFGGNFKSKKNLELIQSINNLIKNKELQIQFKHTKGHSTNKYNNMCDKLAHDVAQDKEEYKGELTKSKKEKSKTI